jgi:hypothetical protein
MTPKRADRLAILGEEARDDGVEGAFSRLQVVRVVWIEAELGTAVLKHDAGSWDDDVAAEGAVRRLDVADHHPVAVRGAQVHRVAATRIARRGQQGALADEIAARGGVILRQELCDRNVDSVGVANVTVGVGEG